jgi:hypothetical protein
VELVDLGYGIMGHGVGQRTRSRDPRSAPGLFRSPSRTMATTTSGSASIVGWPR